MSLRTSYRAWFNSSLPKFRNLITRLPDSWDSSICLMLCSQYLLEMMSQMKSGPRLITSRRLVPHQTYKECLIKANNLKRLIRNLLLMYKMSSNKKKSLIKNIDKNSVRSSKDKQVNKPSNNIKHSCLNTKTRWRQLSRLMSWLPLKYRRTRWAWIYLTKVVVKLLQWFLNQMVKVIFLTIQLFCQSKSNLINLSNSKNKKNKWCLRLLKWMTTWTLLKIWWK